MKKSKRKRFLLNNIFMLPAVVLFAMVIWYPMLRSVFYSFTNYDGFKVDYDFIGLANYKNILTNNYIKTGLWNTFKFALISTVVCNILQLGLALILDMKLVTKKYLRTAFYIPVLLSTVVISVIFGNIMQYQGVFNEILNRMGLGRFVVDWFGNETAAFAMVAGVNIWQWVGYGAIIYLAGLQTIPGDLYESARMDGARPVQLFFKITLPLLMPSVTILTFLNITGGLKMFDLPYTLTNGAPNDATETISMVIYRTAFTNQKMGMASAASVVFLAVIAVVSVTQVLLTRKREVEM